MPQTTPQVLELDKVLTVNDDVYNINAVYADKAGQVKHSLIVNKQTGLAPESKVPLFDAYNGSAQRTMNIVPAEGGAFTGPVILKSLAELGIEEGSAAAESLAVNRADISRLLYDLAGCPCYKWDGETLLPITYLSSPSTSTDENENNSEIEASTDTDKNNSEVETTTEQVDGVVIAKLNIIFGAEADLAALDAAAVRPKIYIYICTDYTNGKNDGKLFVGGSDLGFTSTPQQLARRVPEAVKADNATKATNATNATKATNATYLKSASTSDSYSYETLTTLLNDLQTQITTTGTTTLTGAITTHDGDAAAHPYLIRCIRKLLFNNHTSAIPNPTVAASNFAVYNSDRLGGSPANHYQGRIFTGTATERDTMMKNIRGSSGTYQNGDIWIKLG